MLLDRGCPRVVLCFDCYDNVPEYKNMTQTRRTGLHTVRPFGPDQDLPTEIPSDPMEYLMNRTFKLRVIDYVCEHVPRMLRVRPDQVSNSFPKSYKTCLCPTIEESHNPPAVSRCS